MDLDQIIKRLEWLDDERRKDKVVIVALEERLLHLEGNLPGVMQRLNDLAGEVTRVAAMLGRFDQIENSLVQIRVDYTRLIESQDKQRVEREREIEKMRLADNEILSKNIAEVRKSLDVIPEFRVGIKARVEEDYRLGRLVEEVDQKIEQYRRGDDEFRRAQRLLEEGRRQDAKRIADTQVEVDALRKRVDEQRGKIDLVGDNTRKFELRISELLSSEGERRQTQTTFIDKQNMVQMERDRAWRDWQTRFEDMVKQESQLEAQLQTLDATHRSVKRSQEAFDDIMQRMERRINEITEMQRLVEERFRQEWVAFKADDQKRWTNYTLSMDEQQRENLRLVEKHTERLAFLEDAAQEIRDLFHQYSEDTQKRLQSMLTLARGWVEDYSQIHTPSR